MNYYLNRFSVREQLIDKSPKEDLGLIVVIPCSNEPDLISSLKSLKNCKRPKCSVEVIVIINASEIASEGILKQNKITYSLANEWIVSNQTEGLKYFLIEENELPKKHAGVGLARKIGMDEAVRRFEVINKPKGVIVCFDADSNCDENYLVEIEKHFNINPKTPACSIHFEHPIEGDEYPQEIYSGIIQYELHLRYYKNGLTYAELPYAFHTIGSSMAVRSNTYQKQNGMNKRKAGEDFYFLQKLIPLGGFTEIKTTKVIPSPRVSDRVPFGTGRAMQEWVNDGKKELSTYNVQSFKDLRQFVEVVPELYRNDEVIISKTISTFLTEIDYKENLPKIRENSTSEEHFTKLFFNWFNAFKVLKYVHFARDYFYPNQPVFEASNDLLELVGEKDQSDLKPLLIKYRELDLM